MWVGVHEVLHRALREQRAQLAPQAVPLLAGQTLGAAGGPAVRATPVQPRVPG